MTLPIFLLTIYLTIGIGMVGLLLGGNKTNNLWSIKQFWDQFTSERFSWFFWILLMIGWLPASLFLLVSIYLRKEIRKVIENAVVEYIKTHTDSITASVQKEIRSTIESIESVDRIDVPFIIKLDDDRIDMVSEKIIQIENLLSELEKIITEDSTIKELNFDPNPFLSLIKLKNRTGRLRDRLVVRCLEVGFSNKDLSSACQISLARISQIKQNYLDSRQDKYRR